MVLWELQSPRLLQGSQLVLCVELTLCCQHRPGKLLREQLYAFSGGTAIVRLSARQDLLFVPQFPVGRQTSSHFCCHVRCPPIKLISW